MHIHLNIRLQDAFVMKHTVVYTVKMTLMAVQMIPVTQTFHVQTYWLLRLGILVDLVLSDSMEMEPNVMVCLLIIFTK